MTHLPSAPLFQELAAGTDYVPVWRRLVSDALTPVSAFRALESSAPGAASAVACLFESVIGGEKVGRYSFLATEPYLLIEARGQNVVRHTYSVPAGAGQRATSSPEVETWQAKNPLEALREEVARVRVAKPAGLPPFVGGAIGYAGYDTVRYVEHLPDAPPDDRQLPDMAFGLFDHLLVFDNVDKTLTVIALAKVAGLKGTDLKAAYADAAARVDAYVERLTHADPRLVPADIDTSGPAPEPTASNFTPERFKAAVDKCVDYIRAGDIFQVVISQRFQAPLPGDPFELYRTLRVVNPSPFMFYVRTPDCTLVGSSPEIMVRVVGDEVTVRPLAGTRRRGATEEEDQRLADELLADPKERAEHVMLVDLGRNDVGRVARYGSVELSDVMVIERYSHVMHITSNVTGRLTADKDAFDALAACLPAGTVSGAPKVRAMQIIDELEPHRRGPYAGAVGYLDFGGDMDTCIALRTVVVKDEVAYVQAGAGIVADSDPAAEYQETLSKASGLLKAIEITQERNRGGA
ncbi:anthranilate synthase component I [Botrimarina hoheduenensis]|uniref:Anthranilate synthase component 1 n=1 Tax=Botrimarina hoheduenensis TaxID=2528000 RepID=A0A5C5VVD1_9BACT|nr:anthranilate synthase component I [Botrimarina hoheduenensis]TWT42538.1 Anthranilate synthase component 1 [Botrimarina hoheduenensis]